VDGFIKRIEARAVEKRKEMAEARARGEIDGEVSTFLRGVLLDGGGGGDGTMYSAGWVFSIMTDEMILC